MSTAPTATPDTNAAALRPEIRLLPGRHKRVRAGHPWIFSNEIDMTAAVRGLDPGTLVTARDAAGKPVGVAMFNPRSLIAARLLAPDPAAKIDRAANLLHGNAIEFTVTVTTHFDKCFSHLRGHCAEIVVPAAPVGQHRLFDRIRCGQWSRR